MAYSIYEGIWTDWAMGRLRGTTITLSQSNGTLLLAFIATFIALVSMRLWRILSFTLHQVHATHRAHDGLHFQRQHTLRNTVSPAAAAKTFVLQLWYWRKSKNVVWRTLPWALLSLLYMVAFAVLAVFSSRVSSEASTSRLISPTECGTWFVPNTMPEADQLQVNREKLAYDVTNSAGTARSCYSANTTSLACNVTPVPKLDSVTQSVPCPFGADICVDGKAFAVQTLGIDSRDHLGINTPEADRVHHDRQLTCAPLVSKGYGRFVNDTEGVPTRVQYFYGASPFEGRNLTDFTYEYLLARSNANVSYQVNIWEYRVGDSSLWDPIPALALKGGDMYIIFVEQNSVMHLKYNSDPVFAANTLGARGDETPVWKADRYVSPIACFQQYRFCAAGTENCSQWSGRFQTLKTLSGALSPRQIAIAGRIALAAMSTGIYESINARSSKCLRAQDKMDWLFQMPLPDNQYELEVTAWAQEGLAALQAGVQEYAAGPSIVLTGAIMQQMWQDEIPTNYSQADKEVDKSWKDMCTSQIVRDTQGTLNFSVLGVGIIFALGALIAIFSYVVEPLTGFVQRRTGVGVNRATAWQRDDGLHTLRMLFEAQKRGTWKGENDLVPVTVHADELFFYPEETSIDGLVAETYHSLPNKVEDRSN